MLSAQSVRDWASIPRFRSVGTHCYILEDDCCRKDILSLEGDKCHGRQLPWWSQQKDPHMLSQGEWCL